MYPENNDFSEYSHRFDQDTTAIEGHSEAARFVPIVMHPALEEHVGKRITAEERKGMQIKMAALRIVAGLESRTLRELAKEIGCHHNAIANSMERICTAIGIRRHRTSDETRRRQSIARRRHLASAA